MCKGFNFFSVITIVNLMSCITNFASCKISTGGRDKENDMNRQIASQLDTYVFQKVD